VIEAGLARDRAAVFAVDSHQAGRRAPRLGSTCGACHAPPERLMIANIGTVDRVLRIALGLLLIVLAYAGVIGAWGYLGIVPLLTGVVRFCPAYKLLGMDTCAKG
jgi:hypothetical protein